MYQCHVYLDRKPPTERHPFGEPFYVGIGEAVRVADLKRNIFHQRICAKYPNWSRTVIEVDDNRENCEEFERFLIAEIGRRDLRTGSLVNMTEGGDGVKGRIYSDEERKVLSIISSARQNTPEAKAQRSAIVRQKLDDGTHHFITNHPMKDKEFALKVGSKVSVQLSGRQMMTNRVTGECKLLKPSDAENLDENWYRGCVGRTVGMTPTKGKRNINRDGTRKMVDQSELDEWLSKGWALGRGKLK